MSHSDYSDTDELINNVFASFELLSEVEKINAQLVGNGAK